MVVDLASNPQPPPALGAPCTVGLDRDPPVWHSQPGRMMRVSERQLFVVVVVVVVVVSMELTGGEHEVSVL